MNAQEQAFPRRHRFFDADTEDYPAMPTKWADPKLAAEMQAELEAERDPPYGTGGCFVLLVITITAFTLVVASGVADGILQHFANLVAYIN